MENLFVGVIKNHEGKYFESFSTYRGVEWTSNLKEAKIYTKEGTAKSRVTNIANYYKAKKISYPIPVITRFLISESIDIDQTDRVKKAEEKRRMLEEKSKLALALWKKEQAQKAYDKAKSELERLGRQIQEF